MISLISLKKFQLLLLLLLLDVRTQILQWSLKFPSHYNLLIYKFLIEILFSIISIIYKKSNSGRENKILWRVTVVTVVLLSLPAVKIYKSWWQDLKTRIIEIDM